MPSKGKKGAGKQAKPAPYKGKPKKPTPRPAAKPKRSKFEQGIRQRLQRKADALKRQKKLRARYTADWQKIEKALPRFSKADVGKIMFLTLPSPKEKAKGRRFGSQGINGRRKSFSIFINKNQKPVVIREKGSPAFGRPLSIKYTEKTPKYVHGKVYKSKFRLMHLPLRDRSGKPLVDAEGNIRYDYPCLEPKKRRKDISWDEVIEDMTRELNERMDDLKRADTNFYINIREVVVQSVETGELYNFSSFEEFEFKSRANQQYQDEGLENYTRRLVYAVFAEMLSRHELVTVGSAAYIWNNYNRKRSKTNRKNWVDDRGEKWEKNEFGLVRIKHICYSFSSMHREVSKELREGEHISEAQSYDEEIG